MGPCFTAKNLAICFGLAATAFCVATIVLAVQKASLENDLQDTQNKLDILAATSTTQAGTANPNPTTPTDGNNTTVDDGGITTSDVSSPGSGETTPSTTITTESIYPTPVFPTLPPGLPNPAEILWRLPSELYPIRYRLFIHPNLESGECTGTISIQFQAKNATNLIVLHAKDLEVHNISILQMMARMRIAVNKFYMDTTRELLIIELKELISLGRAYTFSAEYSCKMNGLVGAYRSSYVNDQGNER